MGVLRDYWKDKKRQQREKEDELMKQYKSNSLPTESWSEFRDRMNGKKKSRT